VRLSTAWKILVPQGTTTTMQQEWMVLLIEQCEHSMPKGGHIEVGTNGNECAAGNHCLRQAFALSLPLVNHLLTRRTSFPPTCKFEKIMRLRGSHLSPSHDLQMAQYRPTIEYNFKSLKL